VDGEGRHRWMEIEMRQNSPKVRQHSCVPGKSSGATFLVDYREGETKDSYVLCTVILCIVDTTIVYTPHGSFFIRRKIYGAFYIRVRFQVFLRAKVIVYVLRATARVSLS